MSPRDEFKLLSEGLPELLMSYFEHARANKVGGEKVTKAQAQKLMLAKLKQFRRSFMQEATPHLLSAQGPCPPGMTLCDDNSCVPNGQPCGS